MTTTIVINNDSDDTTAASTPACTLGSGSNLFLTNDGQLFATGSDSNALVMDGTTNEATIRGAIYGTNDGILVDSSTTATLYISSDISGEYRAIDLEGSAATDNITVESNAVVQGGSADGIYANSKAENITVDGAMSGTTYGINLASGTGDITIGSGGSVSGIQGGILLGSAGAQLDVYGTVSGGPGDGIFAGALSTVFVDGQVTGATGGIVSNAGGSSITVDGVAQATGANSDGISMSGNDWGLVVGGKAEGTEAGIAAAGQLYSITVDGAATAAVGGGGGVVMGGSNGQALVNGEAVGPYQGAGVEILPEAANLTVTIGGQGELSGGDGVYAEFDTRCSFLNDGHIVGGSIDGFELDSCAGFSIVNNGTISGLDEAVLLNGSSGVIDNAGTVTGGIGVENGSALSLANTGTVHTSLDITDTGTGTITNAGNWTATIYGDSSGSIAITNSGHITAQIDMESGSGSEAVTNSAAGDIVGAIAFGTGTDTLTNAGAITGNVSFGTGGDTLTNSGTITGSVTFAGKTDTFTNNGAIHGAVTFGTSDTIANDGTVYGTLTLGDGDKFTNTGSIHGNIDANMYDQITVNPGTLLGDVVAEAHDSFHFAGGYGAIDISGFVATGTGHDTLYFSTSDFANYAAVEAHMTQASGDVLITLDAGDVVTLVGTTLSSLSSADFAFS